VKLRPIKEKKRLYAAQKRGNKRKNLACRKKDIRTTKRKKKKKQKASLSKTNPTILESTECKATKNRGEAQTKKKR